MLIRKAGIEDLPAITDIYNQAVINTTATFDTQPKTLEEQRAWFDKHNAQYPVLVAGEVGRVIGWASMSAWSDRCAYADTAEISIYVSQESRGKGVGKKLIEAILRAGREGGLHTAIARIAEGKDVSVHLAESAGFKHIGVMREIGTKFGRLLDVYLMQIIF